MGAAGEFSPSRAGSPAQKQGEVDDEDTAEMDDDKPE